MRHSECQVCAEVRLGRGRAAASQADRLVGLGNVDVVVSYEILLVWHEGHGLDLLVFVAFHLPRACQGVG